MNYKKYAIALADMAKLGAKTAASGNRVEMAMVLATLSLEMAKAAKIFAEMKEPTPVMRIVHHGIVEEVPIPKRSK